jgi:hypothetical protein
MVSAATRLSESSANQLRKCVIGVERRRRDDHLKQRSERAGFGFDPRSDQGLATVGQEHDVAGFEVAGGVFDVPRSSPVWS